MVFISQGCIDFAGKKRRGGYGYTQFMGRQILAHRLAYSLNEMIHPDALRGVVIRHKCDNPACINVEHLEPGTQMQNMDDMTSRGRRARGAWAGGAKLSESDVEQIRTTYRPYSKHANQHTLAQKYGVTQSEISNVINAKRWSHIKEKA